jgi:putative transposase
MIGSQVVQQLTKKVNEMYKSYFSLLKNPPKHMKDKKIHPPHYIKDDGFTLIFQKSSFIVNSNTDENNIVTRTARLSLGLTVKKEIVKDYPNSEGYLFFKIPDHITEVISEIEISPGRNKRDVYINFKYNKSVKNPAPLIEDEKKEGDITTKSNKGGKKKNAVKKVYIKENEIKNIDLENMAKKIMAIDLGVVILASCVCFGLESPILYDGSLINYINNYYTKLISKEQAIYDLTKNIGSLRRMNDLRTRREQKIRDLFEKITNNIMKVCIENKITEIIIGYNPNWKTGVNMGRKMNDKFYKIPYRRLVNMLFYKGENIGINVKEVNESYTSKCDALELEEVCMHEQYSGERGPKEIKSKRKVTKIKKSRGLFQSKRGVLINADVNGAINIMRKGVELRPALKEALEKVIRNIELRKICNPKTIKFQTNMLVKQQQVTN